MRSLFFIIIFLGALEEYPEDFRPKHPLKFYDIVPISAKESANDIENVKIKLRKLLDVLHEMHNEGTQSEIEEFEISLKERGPSLL